MKIEISDDTGIYIIQFGLEFRFHYCMDIGMVQ